MAKLSLMCVDDDAAVLTMYKTALPAMLNADVLTAPDAEAALRLLTHEPAPDVVLIDYMMPGRSGMDLVGALRKHPAFGKSCLILHSAVGQSLKKTAVQAGVYTIIDKPIRLRELGTQIADAICKFHAGEPSPLLAELRRTEAEAKRLEAEKAAARASKQRAKN